MAADLGEVADEEEVLLGQRVGPEELPGVLGVAVPDHAGDGGEQQGAAGGGGARAVHHVVARLEAGLAQDDLDLPEVLRRRELFEPMGGRAGGLEVQREPAVRAHREGNRTEASR